MVEADLPEAVPEVSAPGQVQVAGQLQDGGAQGEHVTRLRVAALQHLDRIEDGRRIGMNAG